MKNPFSPLTNPTVIKRTDGSELYVQGTAYMMNPPSDTVQIEGDEVYVPNLCNDYIKYCDFSEANLRGINLQHTVFAYVDFDGADFTGAVLGDTTFICCYNLTAAKGLDEVECDDGFPILDIRTLELNVHRLPDVFLQKCGYGSEQIVVLRMMHKDIKADHRGSISH